MVIMVMINRVCYFQHKTEPEVVSPVSDNGGDPSVTPHSSVVRVLTNGRYASGPSETSDSTDNEEHEKRRRFKKRYELDRNKSAASHSLPGMGDVIMCHS
jgi:hypothetical protein